MAKSALVTALQARRGFMGFTVNAYPKPLTFKLSTFDLKSEDSNS